MFKFLAVAGFAALSAFGWYTSQPASQPQPAAASQAAQPVAAQPKQPAPPPPGPSFTITYNGPLGSWTKPATGGIPDAGEASTFTQWKIVPPPPAPGPYSFVVSSSTVIPSETLKWNTSGTQPIVSMCYNTNLKMWFTSIGLSSGGFNDTPYGTHIIGNATVTVAP